MKKKMKEGEVVGRKGEEEEERLCNFKGIFWNNNVQPATYRLKTTIIG